MNLRAVTLPIVVWVALGSALGACARYGLGALLGQGGAGFPWATLGANVSGSMLIGAYAALSAPDGRLAPSAAQRQFVMAGLCGGFTTFSLFAGEVLAGVLQREYALAAAYLAVSVPAWLFGAWAGYAAGTRLSRPRRASSSRP